MTEVREYKNDTYLSGQVPRVGDKVVLASGAQMKAGVGHPAVVTDTDSELYTGVEWVRDGIYGDVNQMDGYYAAGVFILVERGPLSDDAVVEIPVGVLKEIVDFNDAFEERIMKYVRSVS